MSDTNLVILASHNDGTISEFKEGLPLSSDLVCVVVRSTRNPIDAYIEVIIEKYKNGIGLRCIQQFKDWLKMNEGSTLKFCLPKYIRYYIYDPKVQDN